MPIHEMKLNDQPFELIRSGKKSVEVRLYDQKRRMLKIGDQIRFTSISHPEKSVLTVVENLQVFVDFERLVEQISPDRLGLGELDRDEVLELLEKIYPKERQEEHEALAISLFLATEGPLSGARLLEIINALSRTPADYRPFLEFVNLLGRLPAELRKSCCLRCLKNLHALMRYLILQDHLVAFHQLLAMAGSSNLFDYSSDEPDALLRLLFTHVSDERFLKKILFDEAIYDKGSYDIFYGQRFLSAAYDCRRYRLVAAAYLHGVDDDPVCGDKDPLVFAAETKDLAFAKAYIRAMKEAGGDIHLGDYTPYRTPLEIAIVNEDLPMISLLLKNGANPADYTKEGKPLRTLTEHPDILALLGKEENHQQDLLALACAQYRSGGAVEEELLEEILSYAQPCLYINSDADPLHTRPMDLLKEASSCGDLPLMQRLLDASPSPDAFYLQRLILGIFFKAPLTPERCELLLQSVRCFYQRGFRLQGAPCEDRLLYNDNTLYPTSPAVTAMVILSMAAATEEDYPSALLEQLFLLCDELPAEADRRALLYEALAFKDRRLADFCLTKGMDFSLLDTQEGAALSVIFLQSPYMYRSDEYDHYRKWLEFLLENGADPHHRDELDRSICEVVADTRYASLIPLFKELGID